MNRMKTANSGPPAPPSRSWPHDRRERGWGAGSVVRAFTLVEVLITVCLLGLLLGGALMFYAGSHGKPHQKSTGPTAQAEGVVCKSNLQQVRMAVQMFHDSDPDGKFPASLADLKLPAQMLVCPDGKEPYQYDPQTGAVHCVHPGHENY